MHFTPQAIFTDYQLDKLSRDKGMKEVYAEVTRQCKLSHPTVDGEMMNSALQEVNWMRNTPKLSSNYIAGDKSSDQTFGIS